MSEYRRVDLTTLPPEHGYRRRAGENNPRAVLTATDIIALREAVAAGAVQRHLARRYGISEGALSRIVHGLAWPHVGGPIKTSIRKRPTPTHPAPPAEQEGQ